MKAKYIAVLLSFFVVTLPVHAQNSIKNNPSVTQQKVLNQKMNLNTAGLSALTGSFKGIGKKRAEAIIAYREQHHGFKSIEELAEVKGISQHFVEVNKEKLNEIFSVN